MAGRIAFIVFSILFLAAIMPALEVWSKSFDPNFKADKANAEASERPFVERILLAVFVFCVVVLPIVGAVNGCGSDSDLDYDDVRTSRPM